MPEISTEHSECLSVQVTPSQGEEWPLIDGKLSMGRPTRMRPDLIIAYLLLPERELTVRGSGIRVNRNGTEGSLRVDAPWREMTDLPDWAEKITVKALTETGIAERLMPAANTVPARCAAGDHSLCLVPDESTGCPGFVPPEET